MFFRNMSDSELADYFAGQALTGLLSNPVIVETINKKNKDKSSESIREMIASIAYEYGKVMVETRNSI